MLEAGNAVRIASTRSGSGDEPRNPLLDLGAPVFTMDIKDSSFRVWIGLGGENSEPRLARCLSNP